MNLLNFVSQYPNESGCRKDFLEKIPFTHVEINTVLNEEYDFEFHNCIALTASVMFCRERE